jgi:hypothetical protein
VRAHRLVTPPPSRHVESEPLGSRETSHLHHSDRQPIPVLDADIRADYSALDRPTITRRAESAPPGWLDLDRAVRDEIRGIAVDQLTKRLGDARGDLRDAVEASAPTLHLVERVARLERSLRMVRAWP